LPNFQSGALFFAGAPLFHIVQNADFICAKRRIFKMWWMWSGCGGARMRALFSKNAPKKYAACAEISVRFFGINIEVFFANTLAKNAALCYNMY
jgi:hypothetical protein